MRPSNKSRSRNKSGNNGSHNHNNNNNGNPRRSMGNIINRVFESAGPDGKVRGTPQQIIDKYQALARDAQLAGDRVTAENYLQHSEHYSRLLGEAQRQQAEARFVQEREEGGQPSQGQPQAVQNPPRADDGYDGARRGPAPFSSGFGMVDTDGEDDFAGPIETPEGRGGGPQRGEPVTEVVSEPMPEPVAEVPVETIPVDTVLAEPVLAEAVPTDAVPAEEAPSAPEAAPAKRPRTRRRTKAAAEVPAADAPAPEAASEAASADAAPIEAPMAEPQAFAAEPVQNTGFSHGGGNDQFPEPMMPQAD